MKIVTNNSYRELLDYNDLTTKEKVDIGMENMEEGRFFRYRGSIYDLSEFIRSDSFGEEWQGVLHLTYDSGVLVAVSACGDGIKVGRFF